MLGVSKSSVHRWVHSNPLVLARTRARKVTSDVARFISDAISDNPFDTPASIRDRILTELKLKISSSAVRFWVKRQSLTRKKTTRFVTSQELDGKRAEFASRFTSQFHPDRVVSIDESSFYFDMKPSFGYCHRSKRLRQPARTGGRMRWSLLMAVTNDRVVGWKLIKGSITSESFAEFISELNPDMRDVLLLDNAAIHKSRHAMSTMHDCGFTPVFIPPYSPEFQPIEHSFSVLKNAFRNSFLHSSENAQTIMEKESDVTHRLQRSLVSLTPSVLSHQFEACWMRLQNLLGTPI